MARRRSVEVIGRERLQRRLAELPEQVREQVGRQAVEESAEAVADEVRANVRVDSGALRDGIEVRAGEDGPAATVGWYGDELYYSHFNEFGTSAIPADPVLTAASEQERKRFPGRLRDHASRELE